MNNENTNETIKNIGTNAPANDKEPITINGSSSVKEKSTQKNNKTTNIAWGIIAISIIALLTALGIYMYHNSQDNDKKNKPVQQTTTSVAPKPKNTDTTSKMPLLDQYAAAPTVNATPTTVSINNNIITSSDNNTLKFNDTTKVFATAQKCNISNPTDFCQVASGKNDKTKESFDIYYLKDAAHSRLFENPVDFQKANIVGSPSSGTMKIDLGGSKANILTIVNKNSSGWLIVMNNNANTNNITKAAAIG